MLYRVTTKSFGTVLVDSDAKHIRKRAELAFGRDEVLRFSPRHNYRLCETCDSAPCVCDKRKAVV